MLEHFHRCLEVGVGLILKFNQRIKIGCALERALQALLCHHMHERLL